MDSGYTEAKLSPTLLFSRVLKYSQPPTLESEIKRLATKPTTNEQLHHALRGDVITIIYTDLSKYTDIRDCFNNPPDQQNPSNNIVLILPVEKYNQGHYISIMYYPDTEVISVFDPYGYSVEVDLQMATFLRNYDPRVQENLPRLLRAHTKSGGKLLVNDIAIQSKKEEIATCGKHCVMRILCRDIVDHKEYQRFLKVKSMSPDEIVTLMFL